MWRSTTTWEKHLDSSLLAPAKVRKREREEDQGGKEVYSGGWMNGREKGGK